jgi:hypothetical protein
MKKLPEITIPNSGKASWYGGAYTIAFVYSNKGNFVIKGYMKEVEEHLNTLKNKGYKYFVNFTLWHNGKHRSIWEFSMNFVYIHKPGTISGYHWTISYINKNIERCTLKFKRLPKTWIKEFEQL